MVKLEISSSTDTTGKTARFTAKRRKEKALSARLALSAKAGSALKPFAATPQTISGTARNLRSPGTQPRGAIFLYNAIFCYNLLMKTKTSWGKVAGWYNTLLEEGQDTYQEKLIKPNLLRILQPKAGEEILDLGCGQGYFSRVLAEAGAKVLGVDVAGELIKLAKDQDKKNQNFLVLSAEKLTGINDNRFNAVICILALQNIKNFQAAILEMHRVLKPGGRAVLVLNHPAFRIPAGSFWGWDEQQKQQYRRVDSYMSEISQKVDMTQGVTEKQKKKYTWSFHRPLQNYFKAFAKAGFSVVRLEEWVSHKVSDKGSRKVAEDKARKEIPLFMCLELKK